MARLLRLGLMVAQVPLAVMVLYLDILTLAAALWRRTAPPSAPRYRFAILVPAHDEELLLPRLLASCRSLDYPSNLFEVHVVADNCRDDTVAVAQAGGAIVHERTDEHQRGKGFALQWLVARLVTRAPAYDAYVFVDADSVVSANLLSEFNAHLARGDQIIQCYYGVMNPNQSWLTLLRSVAFMLYNGIRPRGRDALGLSAGLRGNGMCFAAPVVRQFGWDAVGLAEDVEFHLRLVDAGLRVAFAAKAQVLADMPTSLRQAQSQDVRWERGRLQVLPTNVSRLAVSVARHRDLLRLEALAEQLVPPLSVLMAFSASQFVVARLIRGRYVQWLSSAILVGQGIYVFGGLRICRAGVRSYLALLMAPLYAAWKITAYLVGLFGLRNRTWTRTARHSAR